MLSVNQPWDKLKSCVVGRSYAPELYEYIENPKVRNLLEKIAIETEEDYQQLIGILKSLMLMLYELNIDLLRMERFLRYLGVIYEKPPMCPKMTLR